MAKFTTWRNLLDGGIARWRNSQELWENKLARLQFAKWRNSRWRNSEKAALARWRNSQDDGIQETTEFAKWRNSWAEFAGRRNSWDGRIREMAYFARWHTSRDRKITRWRNLRDGGSQDKGVIRVKAKLASGKNRELAELPMVVFAKWPSSQHIVNREMTDLWDCKICEITKCARWRNSRNGGIH